VPTVSNGRISAEDIFIAENRYAYSVKILRVEQSLHDDGRSGHRAGESAAARGGRHRTCSPGRLL